MTRLTAVEIRVGNWIADYLDAIGEWFAEGSRQLKRCPTCGENLYYGKSCDEMGIKRK